MERLSHIKKFGIYCFMFMIYLGLAQGADWPNWRGPDYTGISAETDWDPEALNQASIIWDAQVGTGFSTISVANDKAYTSGNINKDTDIIYCFDAATGEELWRHEYPEPLDPKWYEGGCSATPTIEDGKLYTISKKGRALCLDAVTGAVIWENNLDFKPPTWGFSGSPVIIDDIILYNVGSAGLALKKKTGEIFWKSDNDVAGYASPVPYQYEDKTGVLIFAKDSLIGVDAKTGSVMWSYPWKTKHDVNAADPIIFDNKVFITSGYGHGSALVDISGPEPTTAWQNKNMRAHMSGPVLIDGYLYGFDDNKLVCLDWKTGEQQWTEKTPKKGSLSAARDKLIIIGEKGTLYIVQASPKEYKEISSAKVLSSRCWSMPTLANGNIYVRNGDGHLVCVDVKKK
jgi:outer membrane protein assembly factor BamB